MKLSTVYCISILLLFSVSAIAQKVIRKGMPPMTKTVVRTNGAAMYDVRKLNGKWQEFARRTLKNENIPFKDTLLFSISNNKGFIKDNTSMNMTMRGDVSIEGPSTLIIGSDAFNILRQQGNMLFLKDDTYIRSMKRVPRFYYETVGKDSIKLPEYNTTINAEMANLKGKWLVYRRQAEPGFITGKTELIKYVTISSGSGMQGSGEITTYNGDNIAETHAAEFMLSPGRLTITSKKGTMVFNTYKANGKELIFGDLNGVLNYAKQE
ncbi:MAG: hypothetical protein WKF88_05945 [Ferruginibacter sp.]